MKFLPILFVAVLLCGVFGGLVTQQSLAFNVGSSAVGGSAQVIYADRILYVNHTVTVPEGYRAVFSSFYVYATNSSAGVHVQGAVYNIDGSLVAKSGLVSVPSLGWVYGALSCELLNGTYYLAVKYDDDTSYYYTASSGIDVLYEDVSSFPATAVLSDLGANRVISFYFVYNFESLADSSDLSSWGGFIFLLVVTAISLLLAWKSNVPILNFVFGAFTLGVAAYLLGSNMFLEGWMNLGAILMGTLCIISGAIKLRGN